LYSLRAKNTYLDICERIVQPPFLNIPAFESAAYVLNALVSNVCNTHEAANISSEKVTIITSRSTSESSCFTVKAFEESSEGSAFIFLQLFKLAHICRSIQVARLHKGDNQANQSSQLFL